MSNSAKTWNRHAKIFSETKYAEAVRISVLNYLEGGTAGFVTAPYSVVFDSPDKGIRSRAAEADSITSGLFESLRSAEDKIVVISPYFVPMKTGVAAFSELQASGVDVTIITNSLAANNQFTVHGGYAPSRKPLLKAGIKLYEVRPDASVQGAEIIAASGAKATLHTKAFIVDEREVFIGSFNFDPSLGKHQYRTRRDHPITRIGKGLPGAYLTPCCRPRPMNSS